MPFEYYTLDFIKRRVEIMNRCRNREKHSSRHHFTHHDHIVERIDSLVLVDSDPENGDKGVDRDITIELVFAREVRRRRHLCDDHHHDCDHHFHDHDCHDDDFHDHDHEEHRVIESIDMWQGFTRVPVNIRRVTRFADMDRSRRRHRRFKHGHRDDQRRKDHRNRDHHFEIDDGRERIVFLVDPVSRLRANTEYKVRIKYVDIIRHDGCRPKRKSADMIVFKTGNT